MCIRDSSDRETITRYFEMLYHIKGESLDKKKIMDEFTNKKIKYRFAQVGKDFRLIEQNTKTVFINCEEEADKILRELKVKGFTRSGDVYKRQTIISASSERGSSTTWVMCP